MNLGPKSLALDKEMTFMLFSPDAVEADLTSPILERLMQLGIQPARVKYIDMRGEKLEKLYSHQLDRMTPHWWLVEKLFSMGRSMAVLLVGDPQSHTSLAERVTKLKGKSDPAKCNPDTLRLIYEAENRVINLIHSPDEPEDFWKESRLFFSNEEIEQAYQDTMRLHQVINPQLLKEHLGIKRLGGFYETLARLKRRIAVFIHQDTHVLQHFCEALFEEMEYLSRLNERATFTNSYKALLTHQLLIWKQTSCNHVLAELLTGLVELPFSRHLHLYDYFEQHRYLFGPFLTEWELVTIQSAVAIPSSIYFDN